MPKAKRVGVAERGGVYDEWESHTEAPVSQRAKVIGLSPQTLFFIFYCQVDFKPCFFLPLNSFKNKSHWLKGSVKSQCFSSDTTSEHGAFFLHPHPPLSVWPVSDSEHHTTVFGIVLAGGMSCLSFCQTGACTVSLCSWHSVIKMAPQVSYCLVLSQLDSGISELREGGKELMDTWRRQGWVLFFGHMC